VKDDEIVEEGEEVCDSLAVTVGEIEADRDSVVEGDVENVSDNECEAEPDAEGVSDALNVSLPE
jgi:hypothetical protein